MSPPPPPPVGKPLIPALFRGALRFRKALFILAALVFLWVVMDTTLLLILSWLGLSWAFYKWGPERAGGGAWTLIGTRGNMLAAGLVALLLPLLWPVAVIAAGLSMAASD